MDDRLSAASLEGLIKLHVDTLRGVERDTIHQLPRLGLLGWLVVDERGWRSDGLYRTHRYLSGLVDVFVADGGLRTYGNVSVSDIAVTMRAKWGLSHYPASAAVAAKIAGLSIHDGTIRRWENRVLASKVIQRWSAISVAEKFGDADPPLPCYPRPRWSDPPEMWPPLTWPANCGFVPERSLILARIRQTREIRTLHETSDEELVALLRQVAAERLPSYFSETQDSAFYRHLLHHVIHAWSATDGLSFHAPSAGARGGGGGGNYTAAVPVAAQMFIHAVANDGKALVKTIKLRRSLQRFLASLPPAAPGRVIEVRDFVLDIPTPVRENLVTLPNPTGVPPEAPTGLEGDPSPQAGLQLAYTVRRAPQEAKVPLAEVYLQSRPTRFRSQLDTPGREAIALADHSVQYDLVTCENVAAVQALSVAMRQQSAEAKWGLLAHIERSMIILNNKQNLSARAVIYGLRGYQRLLEHDRYGLIPQIELHESAQQLDLALAGVFVRLLERSFLEKSGWVEQTENFARGALWWSRSAMERLNFLARDDVEGGLPAERHSKGRIATVGWHIMTRIIRIRTLIAVRTALDTGVCQEKSLTLPERGIMEMPVPCDADLDDSCLPSILNRYRELIVLPHLAVGHHLNLVRSATWLAFLNGGRIPVERHLSPGAQTLDFLDCDPMEIENGRHEMVLDVPGLVLWLGERNTDAGVLSWLPRSGRVARYIDKVSHGQYMFFRSEERRPLVPSHD